MKYGQFELITLDDAWNLTKSRIKGAKDKKKRRSKAQEDVRLLHRHKTLHHVGGYKQKGYFGDLDDEVTKARTSGAKDLKKRKKKGVKRALATVEKFRGGVGIKFDKPPRVEKFRGGIGIRFD